MTLSALARDLGVSKQAVSKAWRSGRLANSIQNVGGRPRVIDLARARTEWRDNAARQPHTVDAVDGGTLREAQRRAQLARAAAIELETALRRGELIDAKVAAEAWRDAIVTARTAFLALPSALRLRHPELESAVLRSLHELICDVLATLAEEQNDDARTN